MYRLLFTALSLFLSIHVYAQQFKVAPVIGLTLATRTVQMNEYLAEPLAQSLPYKKGLMTGVGVETRFLKNFSVQTDFLYSQLGHTLKSKYGYNLSQSYHLSYFTLPISAKVFFTKNKYRPFFTMGAYGSALISATYSNKDFTGETSSRNLPIGEPKEGIRNYYHKYDYGIQLGTGIAQKLGVGELAFEARYIHGLAYTESVKYFIGRGGQSTWRDDFQNRAFSFSLSYAIPL